MERESILASRLEEMQRIQDKRNLEALVKAQKGGATDDSVAKAAKRTFITLRPSSQNSQLEYRAAYCTRCYEGEVAQTG
jgi:hypothetical protein